MRYKILGYRLEVLDSETRYIDSLIQALTTGTMTAVSSSAADRKESSNEIQDSSSQ